jgi:hypothetical protein
MKLLAIASFGLALTVPALARIGETLEQAKPERLAKGILRENAMQFFKLETKKKLLDK